MPRYRLTPLLLWLPLAALVLGGLLRLWFPRPGSVRVERFDGPYSVPFRSDEPQHKFMREQPAKAHLDIPNGPPAASNRQE